MKKTFIASNLLLAMVMKDYMDTCFSERANIYIIFLIKIIFTWVRVSNYFVFPLIKICIDKVSI